MAPNIIAGNLLANGLRNDFVDTYTAIRNRQADGRLAQVMDLNVKATNRQHEFAYIEASPHVTLWRRGDPIPQDAMGSVQFTAVVHEFGRRVAWSKWDRADDQTQSLYDAARQCGESAGLLPERFFFDLINGGGGGGAANTLPFVPNAPDGAVFFATTAGGAARFGATGGNLLTGSGVASISAIQTDYYSAIQQFMLFQDGKGQPLLSPETIAAGAIVIYGAANVKIMEEAFIQKLQGRVLGTDAGTTPSNVVLDASRNIDLWPTPRITNNDIYVFLKNPPKKPTFLLEREALKEFTSLETDNNSDLTRSTAEEYIQWEIREGAGIALPFGAICINNA